MKKASSSSGFSIRFISAMSSTSIVSYTSLARPPAHKSMNFRSSRSSGARNRWCKAASSPAYVSRDGFSSPASNAAALSRLKSSGPTRRESSSTLFGRVMLLLQD